MIAAVTTTITLVAGWMMTVIDRDGFPTLGSGIWWAVQTVTTVGYGDHVPTNEAGSDHCGDRDAARNRVCDRDNRVDHRRVHSPVTP